MAKKSYQQNFEKKNTSPKNTYNQDEHLELNLLQKLVFIFVATMPLLFCKWNDQSPFEMIKAYYSVIFVSVISIIFFVKMALSDEMKFNINKWTIGLFIYLACYWLSFVFAGHYYSSLVGVLNLPAGSMMTVTAFVVLSFICSQIFNSQELIKKLAFAFVVTTILMSLYGIVQHFGGDPINWWVYSGMEERALSTMGQAVGFGTVVGVCLPLCFAFFITEENKNKNYLWAFCFFVMNLGILYSGSRLPILGYFATMVIFYGVIIVFRKKLNFLSWKKLGSALAIILLANAAYFLEPKPNSLQQKLEVQAIKDGYGTRFITWGTAFELFKRNPILGVGPENFGEEFNHIQTIEQNYGESWSLIWHKAHNEYIHYLATTGVVGFSAYLWLIILMFIPVFSILKRTEWSPNYIYSIGLLGGFGFLLMANMTAFSFIPTLMFFYLFPAMNFNFAGFINFKTQQNPLSLKWRKILAGVIVFMFSTVIYIAYNILTADMDYNDARRQLISRSDLNGASEYLNSAIAKNPWNAEYYCFKADIAYNFFAQSFRPGSGATDLTKRELFNEVIAASDECLRRDSRKSDLWRARGTLMLSLSQVSPKMIDLSVEAFKKAIEVYPNNPYNHISLAGVYRKKGRSDLAIESLNAAIDRRRDVIPAFVELMNIYYSENRRNDLMQTVERIKNIPKFKYSEFYPQKDNLIKVATDFKDDQVVKILSEL